MKIRVGILTAPKIEYELRERTFLLKNVRIGIGFHWDRYEDQEFEGELEILKNADGTETAINIIDMEDYLTSVISSEMAATGNIELLKAHAVISRSWALRAMGINAYNDNDNDNENGEPIRNTTGHIGYDVCADDHCQRYEGLRRRNGQAIAAVRATRGQVLTYNGEICDCRYYKCCGGKTEEFETCWEDIHIPYLESIECPYCLEATGDTPWAKNFRARYLNNYDQETLDFHDWTVRYSADQLSEIIRNKSGIDFGTITDLRALKRGKSGRIYALEVVGTKQTRVIGKELIIRQYLSTKCLYSSWFDIEREGTDFVLTGHGWGHGAGLCQIGAAVMAEHGTDYRKILSHYYRHTQICTI